MFKFFGNLFGKNKDTDNIQKHKVDAYTKDHLDEIFAEHFTQNGGYFNYEPDLKSAIDVLQKLFITLDPNEVYCTDPEFQKILKSLHIKYSDFINSETDVAMINCECLVAADGSIMVSHDNIGHYKIPFLPKNIIILSTTNQLVPTKSKGLEYIRRRKTDKLPSNITSLNAKKSQDFLKKEFIKELYLVQIEEH